VHDAAARQRVDLLLQRAAVVGVEFAAQVQDSVVVAVFDVDVHGTVGRGRESGAPRTRRGGP
jgi:hypothetical protein